MSETLRSVLLTPNLLGADGVSCLARQIADALPQPLAVLSLHDPPYDDDGRVSAGGSRPRFLLHATGLALRCRRETIVVCSHLHLAPVARAIAWRGGRVVYVLCGIEAWAPLRIVERAALRSGRLVAISSHTARGFREANRDFRDAAIDVCHPGLPPGRIDLTAVASEPAALIVGRMAASESYKGHDQLLRVWPRVLSRHPEAQLWIVGDGDDRARLEALSAHLGIARAVTFTGRLSEQALEDRYRRCRFFVMPSRAEGFGLVFVEAMRAGKACIGGPGAAAEIIEHGVTGFIVDPDRGDELYDTVVRLFDEPALCGALGRAGASRFHSEFTDARFRARLNLTLPVRASMPIGEPPVI
jgi:phosphatidylinositol alpha-1,6-mannosyltransferase